MGYQSTAEANETWLSSRGSRAIVLAISVVVAVVVPALLWRETSAATTPLAMHLFLVIWSVAGIVTSAVGTLARRPRDAVTLVLASMMVGVATGVAIGTTDWSDLALAGWWQLWLLVPLLLGWASVVAGAPLRRPAS